MIVVYNLFLSFLRPLYHLLCKTNSKVSYFDSLRTESLEKIIEEKEPFSQNVIWMHAASVGELDQCDSIAKVIKKEIPNSYILQSVFSQSVAKKNFNSKNIDFYFYLPLDFKDNYNKIFEKFKPRIIIIAAWDIWPNLVLTANQFNCKVFLACGSLHSNSSRINNIFSRSLTTEVLSKLSGISPSSESSVELFKKFSKKTEVFSCGDSRFDSVSEKIESKTKKFDNLDLYKKGKVIILASTYSECDKVLIPAFSELLKKNYSIWIFPHKIGSERISELELNLNQNKIEFSKYSNIKIDNFKQVIIFDTLGILAFAYRFAYICYVGGAFHNRVHNVIEPAYFGLPICTGKKISHASEALDLNQLGFLKIISNSNDFINFCNSYNDEDYYNKIKYEIVKYVTNKRGSSMKFFNHFIRKEIL
jgi:3-deoxy-D-manno-octulosonic-acid transferase